MLKNRGQHRDTWQRKVQPLKNDKEAHIIDIEAFAKSGGKLPGHLQFIDRDTAGYNPYDFLNLR